MVLTTVLDTVLGVVFVFLVFSLFTSAAGEVIGRVFTWRQRHLWRTLRRLVDGDWGAWNKDQRPKPGTTTTKLVDQLSEHVLIRQLEGRIPTSRTRIGRIETGDFARAIVDVLAPSGQSPDRLAQLQTKLNELPNSALNAHLQSVLAEAGVTLDRVKVEIGSWFDSRMAWLSEAYKRHIKIVLVGIGLVIVCFWNVDAIRVTTEFYRDDALRAAITEEAVSLVESCAPTPSTDTTETPTSPQQPADADELRTCLGDELKDVTGEIHLPVGWPDPDRKWFMRVLGWGIAAVAVSQGAPFWFDVLRRATKLRKQ